MLFDENTTVERRKLYHAIFIPVIFGIFMVLSFVLELGMNWDFHTGGVFPRRIENVLGIFTVIFIHSGWEHLINNLISFLILSFCVYYFYSEIATKVFFISYLFSGLILWIIGRENWHVGASGMIYSLAFFLFFSGLIRKHVQLISISLIVAFIYGSMVWHIFPWQIQDPVSWEGHLSGGITGLILSVVFRKQGLQKPVVVWDDELEVLDNDVDETNEADFLEFQDDWNKVN